MRVPLSPQEGACPLYLVVAGTLVLVGQWGCLIGLLHCAPLITCWWPMFPFMATQLPKYFFEIKLKAWTFVQLRLQFCSEMLKMPSGDFRSLRILESEQLRWVVYPRWNVSRQFFLPRPELTGCTLSV